MDAPISLLRIVAFALPLTLLILVVGLVWVLGILIPPLHANSQKTGRQAIAMAHAVTRGTPR